MFLGTFAVSVHKLLHGTFIVAPENKICAVLGRKPVVIGCNSHSL